MTAVDGVHAALGYGAREASGETSDGSAVGVKAWLSGCPVQKAVSIWKCLIENFFLADKNPTKIVGSLRDSFI